MKRDGEEEKIQWKRRRRRRQVDMLTYVSSWDELMVGARLEVVVVRRLADMV